eukprot:gnl/MRDRNA2_/MRDRNA2_25165_c0_seq1.p1 gnl/MRDRNA2_/MRDRNA2_25165_c0~~gnl/MRDRNA2_/MRDRNA2_25165_c0_seq1.p1  ORF type:complete len:420 (-),score=58.18 gnl/MRDRNA2_/MRDRNA2_25165_c0_seq1:1-1260(-)
MILHTNLWMFAINFAIVVLGKVNTGEPRCSFSGMAKMFTDPVYHEASRENSCWVVPYDSDVDFDKLLQTRRPVLLRGGAWPDWRADTQKWRKESLVRELGDKEIKVRITETEDIDVKYRGLPGSPDAFKEMTLRRFFEDKSNLYLYWDNQGIHDLDESLVVTPKFSKSLEHRAIWHRHWVARSNISATMHWDPDPNLMLLIEGKKTFYMADILQTPNIYVHPKNLQYAQSNPFHPDVSQHPLLVNASFDVCEVYEGDVLYVPSYWWHFVRSETSEGDLGSSIAVNWFFDDEKGPSSLKRMIDQDRCGIEDAVDRLKGWIHARRRFKVPATNNCKEEQSVVFISNLDGDAEIAWINSDGKREPKAVLRPGKQVSMTTRPFHRFEIIRLATPGVAAFTIPCHDEVFVVDSGRFHNDELQSL